MKSLSNFLEENGLTIAFEEALSLKSKGMSVSKYEFLCNRLNVVPANEMIERAFLWHNAKGDIDFWFKINLQWCEYLKSE